MKAGTSTSTISAPASRSASKACSRRSTTSGLAPSGRSVIRPTRRPATPKSRCRVMSSGALADRRRVHRVVARDGLEQQRGIGDRGREGPDLVEAGRERHEPVATHRTVGRLDTDHAAQRCGLADRAAGVGTEAERRRTLRQPPLPIHRSSRRAPGSCRAGCGWGRTPSSRCSIPSRTRRGSSCRRSTAPASRSLVTTVAS